MYKKRNMIKIPGAYADHPEHRTPSTDPLSPPNNLTHYRFCFCCRCCPPRKESGWNENYFKYFCNYIESVFDFLSKLTCQSALSWADSELESKPAAAGGVNGGEYAMEIVIAIVHVELSIQRTMRWMGGAMPSNFSDPKLNRFAVNLNGQWNWEIKMRL